ncbi:hypothetical protein VCHA43P273_250015 [Vibrio chagasii]|nr:hypothetical protein VCHA43P273_250015 [Vibrio chagasii]
MKKLFGQYLIKPPKMTHKSLEEIIMPAPSARLLTTLLDTDYKQNTLATTLFLNRYKSTAGNINLGTAISRTKWPIVG